MPGILDKKYDYKIFEGALWLKIFYHDVDLASFSSTSDAYASNITGRYSILREAKRLKHYGSNFYEFLLEYPELVGYNHWKQTFFPTDESISDKTQQNVTGFYNFSSSWTSNNWGGLATTPSYSCALLCGSINQGWYYAIGMKANCNSYYSKYFHGPKDKQSKVYLWMRVPLACSCKVHPKIAKTFTSYAIFFLCAYH